MTVKNRVQPGDGDPRHGKNSTYQSHECRCEDCTEAHRIAEAKRRKVNPFKPPKLDPLGRIVVPFKMRRKLGLVKGESVLNVSIEDGRIVLRKVS